MRVPTYREQTRQVSVKQTSSAPAAAFGTQNAQALQRAGDTLGQVSDTMFKRDIERQREQNALRVLELDNAAQREVMDFLYAPETGLYNKKGGDALSVRQEAEKKMTEIQQRYSTIGDNPEVNQMMTERLTRLQASTIDQTTRYVHQEYLGWKDQTLKDRINMNNEAVIANWNDDGEFNKRLQSNRALLLDMQKSQGWSKDTLDYHVLKSEGEIIQNRVLAAVKTEEPQNILSAYEFFQKNKKAMDFASALRVEDVLNQAVPKAAALSAFKNGVASVTTKDDIIDFVIDVQEGGDAVASEPDGGIAKFGINSTANPSEDVAKLTRDKAVDIYKKQYWDANQLDQLPENMRLLAFDSVVNHGSHFAPKVIKAIASGASKDDVLKMRLEEYQRLAKEDPGKYGKYLDGWKKRLAQLDTMPNAGFSAKAAQTTANGLENNYRGAGKEFMELYRNSVAEQEKAEKDRVNELNDEIQQVMTRNNGDWTKIPSELRAEASARGIDITSFKAMTDPVANQRAVMEIEAMPASQFLDLNLNAPELAAMLTYEQKQEYLKKQQELTKPENKVMADIIDSTVDYYFRTQNKSGSFSFTSVNADPTAKSNKAKVASMKGYVEHRVKEVLVTGKRPSKNDVMKFASEWLTLQKDAPKDVSKIPEERRKIIEASLARIGLPVTSDSVMAVHLNMAGRND